MSKRTNVVNPNRHFHFGFSNSDPFPFKHIYLLAKKRSTINNSCKESFSVQAFQLKHGVKRQKVRRRENVLSWPLSGKFLISQTQPIRIELNVLVGSRSHAGFSFKQPLELYCNFYTTPIFSILPYNNEKKLFKQKLFMNPLITIFFEQVWRIYALFN